MLWIFKLLKVFEVIAEIVKLVFILIVLEIIIGYLFEGEFIDVGINLYHLRFSLGLSNGPISDRWFFVRNFFALLWDLFLNIYLWVFVIVLSLRFWFVCGVRIWNLVFLLFTLRWLLRDLVVYAVRFLIILVRITFILNWLLILSSILILALFLLLIILLISNLVFNLYFFIAQNLIRLLWNSGL